MRKNELGDFADLHHVPRPHKKQKNHQRGFSEDVADKRRVRVNFKNYLRDLEEQENGALGEGVRPLTDSVKEQLLADFREWSGGFEPSESSDDQLRSYANLAAPADLDQDAVYEYLSDLADSGEQE